MPSLMPFIYEEIYKEIADKNSLHKIFFFFIRYKSNYFSTKDSPPSYYALKSPVQVQYVGQVVLIPSLICKNVNIQQVYWQVYVLCGYVSPR